MSQRIVWIGGVAITVVALITYYPALKIGFVNTDWYFLEWLARMSLPEYLSHYFDPRLQTGWWRPLFGVFMWVVYTFWKADPFAHHLAHLLLHLGNSLLFYFIVWRLTSRWRLAFIATIVYAGLPVYARAVYWISDQHLLAMLFYLTATWFWISYLETRHTRYYGLTLIAFILTFLTKESAITLPITLFLVDRWLLRDKAAFPGLVYRYLPFVALVVPYLLMEYWIQGKGMYVSYAKYGIGTHMVTNLIQSLTGLAFPWAPDSPVAILLLLIAAGVFFWMIAVKRDARFAFLVIFALINLIPVIGFADFFELRYLYSPIMVSAILMGLFVDWAWTRLRRPAWYTAVASGVIALLAVGNTFGVAEGIAGWGEIARQRAVPFRDIARAHPTFPEPTKLYFIEPPMVSVYDLSVMFLLRYGPSVIVDGTDDNQSNRIARLKDAPVVYVYFFDETGKPIQVKVSHASTSASPALPARFTVPIQLEGYEVTSDALKRGESQVLFLYWRATEKIEKDYVIFVHLLDSQGKMISSYDSQPRGGKIPTSAWMPGSLIVDSIAVTVPKDAPARAGYQIAVGLYALSETDRQSVIAQDGQAVADKIVIGPFWIIE